MILSVPLIAIMRIVCQNLEHPYARYVTCVLMCAWSLLLAVAIPVVIRSSVHPSIHSFVPFTYKHAPYPATTTHHNSVAVRIMEGRLLDFDDQGYVLTPQKGEGGAAAAGLRRRREQKLEGRDLLYSSSAAHQEGGQQLRRRHVEALSSTASPIPPAIAPIGVAPASAGGGGK